MRPAIALAVAVFLFSSSPSFGQSTLTAPASANGVEVSVPHLIRLSGTLNNADGRPRTTGVIFAIYKDEQGGAALWQEVQNVLLDEMGHYSVLLGSSNAQGVPIELFASGEARWLGVQVQGEAEQLRTLLVSVPYALKAGDAETLGGKPASSFVTADQIGATSTIANGSTTAGGKTQPSTASGHTPLAANVTGSGSQNVLPKFDASGTNLVNSLLFDSGLGVGIGTTNPQSALQVNGNILLTGQTTHQVQVSGAASSGRLGEDGLGFFFASDTPGQTLRFLTNNGNLNENMRITSAGNIGIGTTNPTTALQINGNLLLTGQTTHQVQLSGVASSGRLGEDGLGFFFASDTPGQSLRFLTNNGSLQDHVLITGAGKVGIGTDTPAQELSVAGTIESTTGGFKFPDGTLQTSAAAICSSNCGGTISGVTAGTGLTGGGTSGTVTLNLATPVAVANGGTGLSSAGNAGTYLRSNGTALQSSTIQASDLPATVPFTNSVNTFLAGQAFTPSGNQTAITAFGAGTGTGVLASVNSATASAIVATNTAPCSGSGANATCGAMFRANNGNTDLLTIGPSGLLLQTPINVPIDNDSATGTTSNLLVKLSTGGNAVITATGDLGGAVGIAGFNAGKAGKALVALMGVNNCQFDNQTVVADYAVVGAAGQCHDAGATYPSGLQVLGRVLGANTGTGTSAQVYLFGSEARGVGPDKLTITAIAFSGFSQTNDIVLTQGNISPSSSTAFTNCGGFTGNNCDKGLANVSLPQGTTITSFQVCGQDNDTQHELAGYLYSKALNNTFGAPVAIASVHSGIAAASAGTQCFSTSMIVNGTIDNVNNTYYVELDVGQLTSAIAVQIFH